MVDTDEILSSELFPILRTRELTDSRDKVYGLMGLASKGHQLLDQLIHDLTPPPAFNYKLPVAAVFREVCQTWMSRQGEGALITFLYHIKDEHQDLKERREAFGWPSWLPDWSTQSL